MKKILVGVSISVLVLGIGLEATQLTRHGTANAKNSESAPSHSSSTTTDPPGPATSAPANGLHYVDLSQWSTYITDKAANGAPWFSESSGESSLGTGGFNEEIFEPGHVVRSDHGVTITATAGAPYAGYSWTSGVLSSYGHEEFTGGYFQIDAKLPDMTEGAWPSFWLLAGPNDPDRDELDLFEGGLTAYDNANYNYSGFLHSDGNVFGKTIKVSTDLSSGVHTYGLAWVPGKSITWYLDGQRVEEVTSAQGRIPSKPMALILDVQMATEAASGWHTVSSGSTTHVLQILTVEYSNNPDAAP